MRKFIILIYIFLGLSKQVYSEVLYPSNELIAPINVNIINSGNTYLIELGNRTYYMDNYEEIFESIPIKSIMGQSTNGNLCKVEYNQTMNMPPIYQNSTLLLENNNIFFSDISEDGCYPEMAKAIIETDKYGSWIFYNRKGGWLQETSGFFKPDPDSMALSVEANWNDKTVTLTANVDNITINSIKWGEGVFCKTYLPNSNRTIKTLKLGEKVTYHTEECSNLENSVMLVLIDNGYIYYEPYRGVVRAKGASAYKSN
ncbi:hypothetical protein [Glaesserella parasuis]|uniref:hypothetical protein n=1 Tax=Glaesserella parasuis TaxID=738 RepID=UPI003B127A02